ncbi:MAG: hypothetical protein ACE5WD_04190 [Candidatus Aminicenantia bacterium]
MIEKHFSHCVSCSTEIEEDQLKNILINPNKVKIEINLWPSIYSRIKSEESFYKEKYRFSSIKKWHWAMITSFLLLAVIMVAGINHFFLKRSRIEEDLIKQETRVIIESATVQGKPAKLYVFQPKNRKMSIIWMEPNLK